MDFKPTILGVAESTHYLVGGTDVDNNFTALPTLGDVAVCNSLSSAKQLLRESGMLEAQLTLQTAYDEMCGLPTSQSTHQVISL